MEDGIITWASRMDLEYKNGSTPFDTNSWLRHVHWIAILIKVTREPKEIVLTVTRYVQVHPHVLYLHLLTAGRLLSEANLWWLVTGIVSRTLCARLWSFQLTILLHGDRDRMGWVFEECLCLWLKLLSWSQLSPAILHLLPESLPRTLSPFWLLRYWNRIVRPHLTESTLSRRLRSEGDERFSIDESQGNRNISLLTNKARPWNPFPANEYLPM